MSRKRAVAGAKDGPAGDGSRDCAAAFVALLATAAPAVATSVDTSAWVCEFCPFESGYRGDVELGATVVSDDSAWFDDATGLGEEGVHADVDGSGAYAGNPGWVRWKLEDLALDSRLAELQGQVSGRFDYDVSWREIPRRQYLGTETIFAPAGDGSLVLPDGWVRAPAAAGFTALDASLVSRDIESDRDLLRIGGRYRMSRHVSVSANYRHQRQEGVKILGGAYFTNSSLLPMPFDFSTDEVELGARYVADSVVLSATWYLSDFASDGDSFRWQNPFSSLPGAETAALAQPPDNRFQQVMLTGSFALPRYETYTAVSASFGRIGQDEAFLPYTTNADLAAGQPPRASLDGKIDTRSLALSVTSQVIDRARLELSYRYDERDNRTPRDTYSRVIVESFLSGDEEANVPYGYRRSALDASAAYRLTDDVDLAAGYGYKAVDRDFQEVAEQTEDTTWGRLRWQPGAAFGVDVRVGAAKRDVDRYNETYAVSLNQNPLLRKYNLAYRYREFGELTLTASLPEKPVTLSLTGRYADDSYTQSRVGLISAKDLGIAGDLGWTMTPNASAYVTVGYQSVESEQSGSQFLGEPDWRASNDDDVRTYGAGFQVGKIADAFGLQVDYTRSDGTGSIDVQGPGDTGEPFPDLGSVLDYVRLRLSWRHSERLTFQSELRYQRFVMEDWALDGVEPGTIPLVLTLGADPYDDEILVFGVGFRYQMGKAR